MSTGQRIFWYPLTLVRSQKSQKSDLKMVYIVFDQQNIINHEHRPDRGVTERFWTPFPWILSHFVSQNPGKIWPRPKNSLVVPRPKIWFIAWPQEAARPGPRSHPVPELPEAAVHSQRTQMPGPIKDGNETDNRKISKKIHAQHKKICHAFFRKNKYVTLLERYPAGLQRTCIILTLSIHCLWHDVHCSCSCYFRRRTRSNRSWNSQRSNLNRKQLRWWNTRLLDWWVAGFVRWWVSGLVCLWVGLLVPWWFDVLVDWLNVECYETTLIRGILMCATKQKPPSLPDDDADVEEKEGKEAKKTWCVFHLLYCTIHP